MESWQLRLWRWSPLGSYVSCINGVDAKIRAAAQQKSGERADTSRKVESCGTSRERLSNRSPKVGDGAVVVCIKTTG